MGSLSPYLYRGVLFSGANMDEDGGGASKDILKSHDAPAFQMRNKF
jgi:hypothetical protein